MKAGRGDSSSGASSRSGSGGIPSSPWAYSPPIDPESLELSAPRRHRSRLERSSVMFAVQASKKRGSAPTKATTTNASATPQQIVVTSDVETGHVSGGGGTSDAENANVEIDMRAVDANATDSHETKFSDFKLFGETGSGASASVLKALRLDKFNVYALKVCLMCVHSQPRILQLTKTNLKTHMYSMPCLSLQCSD